MALRAFCNVSLGLYSWIVDGQGPGEAKRAHLHTEVDVWARRANAESMGQISDFQTLRSLGCLHLRRKWSQTANCFLRTDGPKPAAATVQISAHPTFSRPPAGGKMGRIQPAQKPITTDLLSRRIPANRQAARMLAVHPAFQRMRQYRSIHHENAPQGTRLGRSLCGHLHSPPNTLSSSPDRFAADFVHPGGGDVRQSRSSGLVDQTWPEGRDRPPAGS